MDEIKIINRIKRLRKAMGKFNGKDKSKFSKAEYLTYYCTLSRIDELMELLPGTHWFRRESEE